MLRQLAMIALGLGSLKQMLEAQGLKEGVIELEEAAKHLDRVKEILENH